RLIAQTRAGRPIPKPNSRFAGVQIGVITYSFMGVPPADLISTIGKLGISEVELMSNHAEAIVGAPAPAAPVASALAPAGGRARGAAPPAAPAVSWYTGE